jgi:hypothetical protein
MPVATMRTVYDMEAETRRYVSHELRVTMLELEAQLVKLDMLRKELDRGPASARSWISHAEDRLRDAYGSLELARVELRGGARW